MSYNMSVYSMAGDKLQYLIRIRIDDTTVAVAMARVALRVALGS
jgi:hypothetical protein